MYKAVVSEQKIKIVIPAYMKNMGDSMNINLVKEKFFSPMMTLDYLVNNFLKDFEKHPKLI